MADVLGVAASVAGLMTIADAIVRKGFKFIKDVKDAHKTVEKLVEEVNNFSGVLHSLNNIVERLEEDGQNADPSTQIHYIESCYKTLKKIQDLFDEALPAAPMSRGEKLKWPKKKAHTMELLVEIGRHKATMTLAMSARQMTALLEILAGQDGIRDGLQGIKLSLEADRAERQKIQLSEERQKMLNFLGEMDSRKWQDSNIRLRRPGTGVWFTDGADFRTWLSTDESKLWVNGIPGAGKTILISSIIQGIEKSIESSHALAFFYCDYKDPQTHDPLEILGALAKQLILQDEGCFDQLTEFCRNHTMSDGTKRAHTPEELCQFIRKLSEYFETAMIVVDGLDEITNDRAGVTRLLRSLNTVGGHTKTLFASRPEIDIGYELEDFVQVSIAAMSSDLRLYVASEIEIRTKERKLRIHDPNLKDHIMTALVDGADGMFRWVSCQMDYLCECNNDRDRREALKKLPPDLPSSYERILERVNRSNKENRDLVMKTLHWIAYAEVRLSTVELLQALAVRDGERHFDSNSMTTVEDVLHWCSSLVRRGRSFSGREILELAHFTVKEFLEAIDAAQTPCYKQYCLSGDHFTLAKACLNFLLCQEFDGSPYPKYDNDFEQWIEESDSFCKKYSFSDYACEYWSLHVHESNWEVINTFFMELFNTENMFAHWTLRWLIHKEYHRYLDFEASRYFEKSSSPTALHWAAVFALDKVCAILIEKGMSVSQQSAMGTPLNCAIVSEYAIYKTFEIPGLKNIEDRSIWRRSERQSVVRQLVNTGLDLENMVDAEGQRTAMSVALALESTHDDQFMAFTLLDAGAKISADDLRQLHTDFQDSYDFLEPADRPEATATLYGITVPYLIKAATAQTTALVQGAEFEFFSFILEVLSSGWSIEDFHPFVEVKFSEMFAACGGFELDEIIRDGSIDPRSRFVKLLSTAIRNSAPTKEKADSRLQDSLGSTVRFVNPSIMALLFQYNTGLSASGLKLLDYVDQELNCLHWVLLYGKSTGPKQEVIHLLISHGASVTNPDEGGITAIELAAEFSNLDVFQMMWDSAMSPRAFRTSPELLEKVLCSAMRNENESILKFLARKLHESKLMPQSSMLEFAVGQETSSLLKLIIEQEDDFNCHRINSCIFGEEMEEESEDCSKALECNRDHGNQYMDLDIDTTARKMSYHHEALYLAAKPIGSLTNFTFLVDLGQPASHHNHIGHTILYILAANHDENSVSKLQYLLENSRLMLDLLNNYHLRPLALAVQNRNIRGMERILIAGANLDTLLAGNETALHIACYTGNKAAAEVLLKRGCHTSQRNLQGQTPIDLALAFGYQEIATTIQNFIDSALTCNGRHTFPAKIERLLKNTTSNFAQTENHGSLPLRVVQETSNHDLNVEDGINSNNFTANMDNDRIAESSKAEH